MRCASSSCAAVSTSCATPFFTDGCRNPDANSSLYGFYPIVRRMPAVPLSLGSSPRRSVPDNPSLTAQGFHVHRQLAAARCVSFVDARDQPRFIGGGYLHRG